MVAWVPTAGKHPEIRWTLGREITRWVARGIRSRQGHLMKYPRRQFLHLAAGAAALGAMPRVASAQAYPSRPVTMIVPFAPGGSTDVAARIVGEHMSRTLGQQVIVENVPGAGGTTGSIRAMRANPDGH